MVLSLPFSAHELNGKDVVLILLYQVPRVKVSAPGADRVIQLLECDLVLSLFAGKVIPPARHTAVGTTTDTAAKVGNRQLCNVACPVTGTIPGLIADTKRVWSLTIPLPERLNNSGYLILNTE